jgi:hypothetical protein
MVRLHPTGVRAGSGVQQRTRSRDETIGARAIEPQVPRETKMRQRVPTMRAAFSGHVTRIERQKIPHTRRITQNRSGVDVRVCDRGMCGENRLGALKCA